MMSQSPRHFNIFTLHVTANVSVAPFVSTTVDVPYPEDFTYMHKSCSPSESAVSCKNMVVTLNSGKFAVFGDTLDFFRVVLPVLCL